MDIDKIIGIVRTLKEEGGPTVSMGSGQISDSAEAGDDPPVKKKKKYIYAGRGSRRMWMQNG